MKLIRFLSEDNRLFYGKYEPDRPDQAVILAADPFDGLDVTSNMAKIKQLLAPVIPRNVLALGLNYRKHADETKMPYPEVPIIFSKATSSVIGHQQTILLPTAGNKMVDYEGELAVIIGKKGKNISQENVWDYIFGYTCANDVSARDWQMQKQQGQWYRGKSFDTFCPLGPYIVTKDEIDNPDNLKLQTTLNGKTVQNSNTSDMIFNIPAMISFLSHSMTLLPGTVILTGTPEGVGFTRTPPLFLSPNDTVSVEIEKIGILTNRVAHEETRSASRE
ncbi:MAG: fumarylacetoacetate hydrolase family protein [Deltaproteobacteria bacterium]|nr:fumarylacetoacetate hydrolase family protein [Deltaproteobacteria bacterium]